MPIKPKLSNGKHPSEPETTPETVTRLMKQLRPTMKIADSAVALKAMDQLFKAKLKTVTKEKLKREQVKEAAAKTRMIVLALLDGLTEMIPHENTEDSLIVLEGMRDLIGAFGVVVRNWEATLGVNMFDVENQKAIALDKFLKTDKRKSTQT